MISFETAWAGRAEATNSNATAAETGIRFFRIALSLGAHAVRSGSSGKKTAAIAHFVTLAADASLLVERELRAAIQLPATLVMLGAELLLFAIAHRTQAFRTHPSS